ncbi:hypothetical protein PIB30_066325 [Stylosanthes scabra]|uniref:Uncharacterized protein n=1 Tax=Stylosanthes scabra TaxID=79078 RepID=A0ABU6YKE6_9FABA|nr:hypothetical protein [Stylosanthes scabra]
MEDMKAELAKAKEELIIAKESAIQSWLDSKPLIDELEKQKSNLAEAQQASKASKTAISELESQLQTTTNCIKSKREEHLKEESMIQEIKLALNRIRHEIENAKVGITKIKQEREKLRRIVYLRKQRIKTLRLASRAVTLELEALEESKASVVQQQVYHSVNRTDVIIVTREEYNTLKRIAKRKYSKANSLAAVSGEQMRAAEASHEVALSRLDTFSGSWSMKRRRVTRELYSSKRVVAKRKEVVGEGEVENNKGRRELSPKFEEGKAEKKNNGIRIMANDVRVMKKKKSVLHKVHPPAVPSFDRRNPPFLKPPSSSFLRRGPPFR